MGAAQGCHGRRLAIEIGIFAKTFARPTLADTLEAVVSVGLRVVQFNLCCAGLPTLPGHLHQSQCETIRAACAEGGLSMAAISGTFNMAHPQADVRRDGLRRLRVLAEHGAALGTAIITLCSGTRDEADMWRWHPDNHTAQSWREMRDTMREAARIGEDCGVTMAFEPEIANIVDSARQARRLLDEIGSPRLKVVLDGANIFQAGELARQNEILHEACSLLRGDIALAHAKDLARDGVAGQAAAGTGLLDYESYLKGLRDAGYDGPLILHGLSEAQVSESIAFLRAKLARLPMPVEAGHPASIETLNGVAPRVSAEQAPF